MIETLNAQIERLIREKRSDLENKLGNECFICHEKKAIRRLSRPTRLVSLSFHRKNGEKHPSSNTAERLDFIEAHLDEFVLLCSHCHGKVHHCRTKADFASNCQTVRDLASFLLKNRQKL